MSSDEIIKPSPTDVAYTPQNPLAFLRRILSSCKRVFNWGQAIQNPQRKQLAQKLQRICSNCQDTYHDFIKTLSPLKKAYNNPRVLADEAMKFSQKPEYRAAFKPDKLCGDVAELLERLNNNLDPLKYSVAFNKIGLLRKQLQNFQNYDLAFYQTFDGFARDLGRMGADLQRMLAEGESPAKIQKLSAKIRRTVEKLEDDISKTLDAVNKTQREVGF